MPSFWGCRCCGGSRKPEDCFLTGFGGAVGSHYLSVLRQSDFSVVEEWAIGRPPYRGANYWPDGSIARWDIPDPGAGLPDYKRLRRYRNGLVTEDVDDYGPSDTSWPSNPRRRSCGRGGRMFVLQDQLYSVDDGGSVVVFDAGSGLTDAANIDYYGNIDGSTWVSTLDWSTGGIGSRSKARLFDASGSPSVSVDIPFPSGEATSLNHSPLSFSTGSDCSTDQDGNFYLACHIDSGTYFKSYIYKVTPGGSVSQIYESAAGVRICSVFFSDWHNALIFSELETLDPYNLTYKFLNINGTSWSGSYTYFQYVRGTAIASPKNGNVFIWVQWVFGGGRMAKLDPNSLAEANAINFAGGPTCIQN